MDASYVELVKDLLKSGEVDAALKALHQAVEKGDAEACSFLGQLYMEGKYVRQDVSQAKRYFNEGAQMGDKACEAQGNMKVFRVDKKGNIAATKQNVRDLFRLAQKGYEKPLMLLSGVMSVFPRFIEDHAQEIEGLFENAIRLHPDNNELRLLYVQFCLTRHQDRETRYRVLSLLEPLVARAYKPAVFIYLDLCFGLYFQHVPKETMAKVFKLIKELDANSYCTFRGFYCLANLDGPGAFASFQKGYQAGDKLSSVGMGYCYVHGIGTARDLERARTILEPLKDVHPTVWALLARIEMLSDPEHPQIAEALVYLDTAEDRGYSHFNEEVSLWLLWCKRRQIPLLQTWEDRLVELFDEGVHYGSELLHDLTVIGVRPYSDSPMYADKVERDFGEDRTTFAHYNTLHELCVLREKEALDEFKVLALDYRLDWSVRCEFALAGALAANAWIAPDNDRRVWFMGVARRLSQGVYDELIDQCQLFFDIREGVRVAQEFLSYYAAHEGEPLVEYSYAWLALHGGLGEAGPAVCVTHIERIKSCPLPNFYELCAQLLEQIKDDREEHKHRITDWACKDIDFMEGEFVDRMLCGSTAISVLDFWT